MANFKNTTIANSCYAVLPTGTSNQRPTANSSLIRYNTERQKAEVYDTAWRVRNQWYVEEQLRTSPGYTPHLLIQAESFGISYTGGLSNVRRQLVQIDGSTVLNANSPRSYRLTKLVRNSQNYWQYDSSNGYDVYGSSTAAANALAYLQTFADGDMLILNTYDEPNQRTTPFSDLLISEFGSNLEYYRNRWSFRDAHLLISIKGSSSPIFEAHRPTADARIVMSAWYG